MSNRLTVEQIYQVIDNEILWCTNNPDKALSAEYRKGFTNGLVHAKHLIQAADDVLQALDES